MAKFKIISKVCILSIRFSHQYIIFHREKSILEENDTAIQTLKQHTNTLGIGLSYKVHPDIQRQGDFLQLLKMSFIRAK